jgi:hypothetical protein
VEVTTGVLPHDFAVVRPRRLPFGKSDAATAALCLKTRAGPRRADCELSIPLERLRLETHRLALPPPPLPWQISKSAAPLRFLVRPLIRAPSHPRGRPAQTLHSTHGFGNFQASGKFCPRLSCFTPARDPGMNPASRPTGRPRRPNAIAPGGMRTPAFASASRPFSLPLRSAKLTHSRRPRFELLTQMSEPIHRCASAEKSRRGHDDGWKAASQY